MDNLRLLVLLKPDQEQPALERAAQYARLVPSIEIVACRVFNEYTESTKGQLQTKAEADFEQYRRHYSAIENMALKVLFSKNVPKAFVSEAGSGSYNLAIISANRRNTIKDLFVSTIDSSIMRMTPIPLLVVKNAEVTANAGQAVLIAVDFTETDKHHDLDDYLVESARKFARHFNGEVHIVNCISPQNRGKMSGKTGGSKILGGTSMGRADIYLKVAREFAAQHGIAETNVHVLEGRVDAEIPRLCAKIKARLVCMGTEPRSSFFGAVDSLASELVLEQIRGDVFIVSSVHLNEKKESEKTGPVSSDSPDSPAAPQ